MNLNVSVSCYLAIVTIGAPVPTLKVEASSYGLLSPFDMISWTVDNFLAFWNDKYSIYILCISCPIPGISHLFKKCYLFLMRSLEGTVLTCFQVFQRKELVCICVYVYDKIIDSIHKRVDSLGSIKYPDSQDYRGHIWDHIHLKGSRTANLALVGQNEAGLFTRSNTHGTPSTLSSWAIQVSGNKVHVR